MSGPAMSVIEAAKYLGVGRNTIYRLMNAGRLPSSKILDRRVIRQCDLDRLLTESQVSA